MNGRLMDYVNAKGALLEFFGCGGSYDVRVCAGCAWRLVREVDASFLLRRKEGEPETKALVAKKDGEPLVFRRPGLTMIIAIDCIKIAFILENQYEERPESL